MPNRRIERNKSKNASFLAEIIDAEPLSMLRAQLHGVPAFLSSGDWHGAYIHFHCFWLTSTRETLFKMRAPTRREAFDLTPIIFQINRITPKVAPELKAALCEFIPLWRVFFILFVPHSQQQSQQQTLREIYGIIMAKHKINPIHPCSVSK